MRPTQAEIDLAAIRHNLEQIRSLVPYTTTITAVVKANAYGHGVLPVSQAALTAGANSLAVAIPEEGLELRQAGFTVPILILGLILPEQAPLVVQYDLIPTVCFPEQLAALATAGRLAGKRSPIMIKVDTGMSRIGLPPTALVSFVSQALSYAELEVRGVFTHLASADAFDKEYADRQLATFQTALAQLARSGITLSTISAANSAGIIDLPSSHFNTIRPGIILYGLPPSHDMHRSLELQPAMRLLTKVVYVKEALAGTSVSYSSTYSCREKTWLATLPLGYADGYHRALSNKACVLIGGKRRPIAGRVCMDQIVVDIGPICDVAIGDEAVLFGHQGDEVITVTELADLAGTINYELVCAISARVPRVYRNE